MHRIFYVTALTFSLIAAPSFAGVGKISSPRVTKGETEVEFSAARYGDDRKSLNNKQSHTYEFEYGFSDDFKMGIEAKSSRAAGGDGWRFEGYGIEAQLELTQQGPWWLNSAIKAEYLRTPRSTEADEVELNLLASRSYGASSLTINVELAREFGDNHDESVALGSALQAKHAYSKAFAPGLEWHADYGKLNDLGTEEAHYVGPIVSGEVLEIGYTLGYYWGLNDAAADNAMRMQIGYEF